MAYENKIAIESCVKKVHEQQGTIEKTQSIINEIEEVYHKAKILDEVKGFIIRKLKEEEEEKPRTLLSDYDFGLYQAYDNVDDIIQEHLEDE
ncbi:hypothetical protein AOB58_774 [Staphylococcus sp. AntiMn-1]|uniref:hypothetical protein n=1 Tax=Staphylococcus sp. AntiMn-1 TaxID=1715860 RepID=UPI0007EA4149|nr:hypothetical protein [Staphylococcus sp. AntiMn-1]ANK37576.1 hypothetical protein AOB58_774 [Staphylococcus sp. AntiMn-1]